MKTLIQLTAVCLVLSAPIAGAEETFCNVSGALHGRMTGEELKVFAEQVGDYSKRFEKLDQEVSKAIVGQSHLVNRQLIALLTNGHILLEGLPGLAKTTAIKTLASAVQGQFKRIQFTSDLLPADVVGTVVFNSQRNEFVYKRGPVFANFLLADEINRASGKVQSGMLQLMEEKIVTVGENTEKLPRPFVVMATQNPIEQEGTYKLPEAQMDRFIMKVTVTYPQFDDELRVISQNLMGEAAPKVTPVMSIDEVLQAQEIVSKVELSSEVLSYIMKLVDATRNPEKYGVPSKIGKKIRVGASPRGGIGLAQASKALAFLKGKTQVTAEEVSDLAVDVLAHRLTLTYEAEVEGITKQKVIEEILKDVKP